LKTLILYRSFLGSSKQYAEWLHEDVPSDIMKFSKAGNKVFAFYDTVVLLGGTYAGWLSLAAYLKNNWKRFLGKRIVFITVAGAAETESVSVTSYSKIPESIRTAIKHFHLRGKLGKTNISEVKKEKLQPIVEYLRVG
jgi:hypothetical protein